MFPEKHVRVFPETRTRICENTYVLWETDNEVLKVLGKMYNNYVGYHYKKICNITSLLIGYILQVI